MPHPTSYLLLKIQLSILSSKKPPPPNFPTLNSTTGGPSFVLLWYNEDTAVVSGWSLPCSSERAPEKGAQGGGWLWESFPLSRQPVSLLPKAHSSLAFSPCPTGTTLPFSGGMFPLLSLSLLVVSQSLHPPLFPLCPVFLTKAGCVLPPHSLGKGPLASRTGSQDMRFQSWLCPQLLWTRTAY